MGRRVNPKVGDVFYDKECEDAFVVTELTKGKVTYKIIMERAGFIPSALGEINTTSTNYIERHCTKLNALTELERIIYGVNIL